MKIYIRTKEIKEKCSKSKLGIVLSNKNYISFKELNTKYFLNKNISIEEKQIVRKLIKNPQKSGRRITLSDGSFYPSIPTLCKDECGETVWSGNEYIFNHHAPFKNHHHSSDAKKEIAIKHINKYIINPIDYYFPKIPVICNCMRPSCYEICWNGSDYIKGHSRFGLPSAMQGKSQSDFQRGLISILNSDIGNPMYSVHNLCELSPNWHGGKSFEPYSKEFNRYLKEQVRIRDNYTCQLCDKIQIDEFFNVHHINYNKKDSRPENLISLCDSCHSKTNSNRKYYEQYFTLFMENKLCQK